MLIPHQIWALHLQFVVIFLSINAINATWINLTLPISILTERFIVVPLEIILRNMYVEN